MSGYFIDQRIGPNRVFGADGAVTSVLSGTSVLANFTTTGGTYSVGGEFIPSLQNLLGSTRSQTITILARTTNLTAGTHTSINSSISRTHILVPNNRTNVIETRNRIV